MNTIFTPMKRSEIREAAQVAARAFHSYEYFITWFPDPDERFRITFAILWREFKTNFRASRYLVGKQDGIIVCVAQLNPPSYRKPSDLRYILSGWLNVYREGDRAVIDSWLKMDADAGIPCHEYQKTGPGIWYASSLTVEPSVQGTGVGSRFIEFWEEYIRKNGGRELVFFTNSEKNIAFYKKRGFEVFDYRTIEYNGTVMGSWSVKKVL
ncbi:MAG: GNAT family N-acetyltransferase [Bacteroidales bacterium]|nr:GNAT family N-acetyltransferase [Bacteroidales bacterium]